MAEPDAHGDQAATPADSLPGPAPDAVTEDSGDRLNHTRIAFTDSVTPMIFRAALSLHTAADATDDPAVRNHINSALADLDTAIHALNEVLRHAVRQTPPGHPEHD